jgi:uncharacterized protein YodC (DUF2158 family)
MAISSKTQRLEAGDLVRVKSGGHSMTVARVDYTVQRPYARCAWVDARGTFRFVSIETDAVQLVDPDDQ